MKNSGAKPRSSIFLQIGIMDAAMVAESLRV
jgi:hypothetical protein